MMGILRTILFAATGLAATGAAFAQQTDSASLFRTQREHASPVAALAATAYATPALRSEAFAGSLSEISVGYEMRREEKALEQQKGDGGDFGRFSAGSYKHISGKGTVWGDAGYLRGAKRNVVWNASSDYDLVFPYVVADSIGGDLTSEEYTFGGGYGHRSGRYTWALEAGARALHEYRDSDPRIRNVAIDIDAGAGASVRMGNYRLGLSAALRVYKQSGSQIQYAHSAGEKGVYHLSGLGSHYAGFEGNANSQTRYRGSGYGLTLALVPDAGRGGLHLAAGYEYLHIEKELPGSADLVLQKVVPRSFHAEAAWLGGSGNGLRWGVALKARYDYRGGDEGIVDDNNSSQGSGTLGFLTLFEYSALQGRAEAVFGVEAAGHAWYVCPWGEYRRRTSDYLYPAQNMEFTRAGGGVDFRCVLQRRSLLLRLEAGGGYTAGLDSDLTLPVADLAAPLVRMVQYDYGRLRQDAATFRLGLRADYALRRRMSLFLAADYGGGLYGDNTAAHHARVACGIAF